MVSFWVLFGFVWLVLLIVDFGCFELVWVYRIDVGLFVVCFGIGDFFF